MRQKKQAGSTSRVAIGSVARLAIHFGLRALVFNFLFALVGALAGLLCGGVSLALAAPSSPGLDDTKAILEKARLKLDCKKNEAHVLMKIVEAGGEIKEREMDLAILQTATGSKARVRMTAPADSKGTALLAVVDKGEQQQWLYLPSSKEVRRIASVNKSSGILGSELTAEDMNPDALKDAAVKLISNDGKSVVIRLTPKAGTSDYAYAQTTFDLSDDLPKKTEYYKADILQKSIEFQDYKSFGGGIVRAQKIHIVNPIKNRSTDIVLTNVKTTAKFSDSDFTPQALKYDW